VLTASDRGLLFNVALQDYPVVDFVGIYSEMSNIVRNFNKLNHRNNKKSGKQLYKHAMHLIRLLMTGTDILLGKGIVTRRREEQALLMEIRNGGIGFDEVFSLANEYQKKFHAAAKQTKLPYEPDGKAIDDLMIKIYEMVMLPQH
jgi:hypothetical protein